MNKDLIYHIDVTQLPEDVSLEYLTSLPTKRALDILEKRGITPKVILGEQLACICADHITPKGVQCDKCGHYGC